MYDYMYNKDLKMSSYYRTQHIAGADGYRRCTAQLSLFTENYCNMQCYIVYCDKYLGGGTMTNAVRVSDDLVNEAKIYSKIDKRSITGQIEHWARIGKCAEENPDLTYRLIKEILIGAAELDQGEPSEYKFG